jgi:hypothetical protein
VERLRDALQGGVGRGMTAGSEHVRGLGAQAAQRVAFGLPRTLEGLLVASLDGVLLRLLELLARAEETTDVDLSLARKLVDHPHGDRRLLQLLDRRVPEPLRELVARRGELLQRQLVEPVHLVGHDAIVANLWHPVAVRVLLGAAVAVAALLLVPTAPAAIAPLRWCGNDIVQSDRVQDRMGGEQIHVIYAIPADGADRFGELASPIATDVAAIDAWWRREDPSRAPRFDLFEFPGCGTRFGMLDLTLARLPDPGSVYVSNGDRFRRIATQLAGAPFAFAARDKKYLVFYDGAVADDRICGTGSGGPVTGGPFSYAVVYLRSSCDLTIGDGGGNAYVAAHELLHMFGALPPGAPNACPGDDGHPCDSSVDVLSTFYDDGPLDGATLDVNRDDYYAHGGSWFDVQDSRWLLNAANQAQLTLRVSGPGFLTTGAVGQECVTSCISEWNAGTSLELVAEPRPGAGFATWTGVCAGKTDPFCLIQLGATTEVGAVFRPLRQLALRLTGRGTVTAPDLRCSRPCSAQRVEGSRVTLRARAARGWRFVRWSGACRGTRPICTLQVGSGGARASAVFARRA